MMTTEGKPFFPENTAFCLEFNKMVFGEGTRISPESISTPGSVLYFALVTDGGPRVVTGWTRSPGWSMVSTPGCLADGQGAAEGATGRIKLWNLKKSCPE